MCSSRKCGIAVVVLTTMAFVGWTGNVQAQRHQSRLSAIQQQNAFQQQQNAVQNALQMTTILVQTASQQRGSLNGTNFQPQQAALQFAMQQTSNLVQSGFRQNNNVSQMALGQMNTLQSTLQQTMTIQDALPGQAGLLTRSQLQILSQEQSALMGLLTTQPPAPMRAR